MTDEEKQQAKAHKRILRAMDTNAVMCADCGVTILDMHSARIEHLRGAPFELKKCKSPFRDCKAEAARKALVNGPAPKPVKITAKKRAAFKKRAACKEVMGS